MNSNAYRQVVRKVFPFQMLGETSILTLPGKVPLDKNFKMMFCVAIWIWLSPFTYWNINSSSKIHVLQWLLGFKLVYCSQKVKSTFPNRYVWLLFIETQHILDMACCHKHQHQRHHNKNTKICMFIICIFPLTKAISIMFERVTTLYQTL